ncbi:Hypothetical_protein [Hexamita inflata]|uniref:Hypothetical_protein n=1 Tax=Hexamita inflata TaxID=28002 RepID=A0AA86Q2J3_9EUKA|nr:Hypothetical protein HINF_LOCUS38466 [Hexamita inflata]
MQNSINKVVLYFVIFTFQKFLKYTIKDLNQKLDPQSLKICFNLIRQLASFFQTQLITLFENAHMSDCVSAIRGQAKENRIDQKGNKFFIAAPEPKNEAEYKKFNDMFQQHVQQNVKAVPIITDLKSYYQYVENKSKCGAE